MPISLVEQGGHEWHALRHGKVTGTSLTRALGSPKVTETLLYELVAARMTEPNPTDLNSAAVQRGRDLEPAAIKAVEEKHGVQFEPVGMMLDDEFKNFGVSPDGVYFDDILTGEITGGVETKCPGSKKHVEYLINDVIPKEYDGQVMAAFMVCPSVEWWIFASYDDRNYEFPLFTKKVTRADYPNLDADRAKLAAYLVRVELAHLQLTF
tara:strand:+ start:2412 stop:3038 length:627 start_codon:yes stop_codon:yes gene_type:complete